MKKKMIAITIATMLALGGCGNAQSSNLAAATASEQAATTEAAEKTTEAAATAKATATPKPTVTPKETTAPKPSEAPKQNATASAAPAATAAPQAATTAAPAATAAPKTAITAAPAATAAPQAATTAAPAETARPQATQAPEATPRATAAPTQAPAPAATSAPTAHSCTWDNGSVTTAATCAREGVMTYTCTGCGATRTESIGRTDHNYVTETTQATCTTGGGSRTYCTVCGEVQSETHTEGGAGHSFEKHYALGEGPTCTHAASYIMICSRCGAEGETGSDPATEHVYVEEILEPATCNTGSHVRITCSVCGLSNLVTYQDYTDDHDWEETSGEVFNEETLEWETVRGLQCSRCGACQIFD